MTAEFEKLTYDGDMLKQVWLDAVETATELAGSNWTSPELVDFIKWLSNSGCSSLLFPGFSLGRLLLSKPKDGKLNYQQTLEVSFDNQTELFTMRYSDWDTIEHKADSAKAVQWNTKCRGVELAMRFKDFRNWKKDWC